MVSQNRDSDEAARNRERLASLAAERQALQTRLADLVARDLSELDSDPHKATVTGRSPVLHKFALFHSLFRDRDEV